MKPDINEVLNEYIEAIISGEKTVDECLQSHRDIRAELEPLLVTAMRLADVEQMLPDAGRKQQARERLMAAVDKKRWEAGIDRKPAGAKASATGITRWRTAFMRISIITLIFVILSGGTMALAKGSQPGSPLYPVKLAVEKAKIRLAGSDEARSRLYMESAKERLREVNGVQKDDERYPGLIEAISENIKAAKAAAGDNDDSIETILTDLARHNREVLADVLKKVPESAKPAIERALNRSGEDDDTDVRKSDDSDAKKGVGDGQKPGHGQEDYSKGRTQSNPQQPGAKSSPGLKRDASDEGSEVGTAGDSSSKDTSDKKGGENKKSGYSDTPTSPSTISHRDRADAGPAVPDNYNNASTEGDGGKKAVDKEADNNGNKDNPEPEHSR